MSQEYKSFDVSAEDFKDDGSLNALFATYGERDSDGDLFLPGSIHVGGTLLLDYEHDMKSAPIGRGDVRNTNEGAVFAGKFFSTTRAQEVRTALKEAGDLQQYSWHLENVVATRTSEGRNIKSVSVGHVCPVYRGAGKNTRTLDIKAETTSCPECGTKDAEIANLKSRLKYAAGTIKTLSEEV